ncbi:MAG: hypothetical protein L6R36_009552, partial [Xanthoria steineri]
LSVDIGNFRQDAAETFQQVKDLSDTVKDLSESVADIRKAVTAGNPVQPPTDPEAVKHALRDPAARMESAWLLLVDGDQGQQALAFLCLGGFMLYYLKQKEHGGNIESPSAFQPAASARLLTSANHQAMAPFGKTASDSLPATMLAPSTAGTSFPFAAALPGKHVKIDLPKPSKFSRIAVDSDI